MTCIPPTIVPSTLVRTRANETNVSAAKCRKSTAECVSLLLTHFAQPSLGSLLYMLFVQYGSSVANDVKAPRLETMDHDARSEKRED